MLDTTSLPSPLYRAEQVRELDRIAIEEYDILGLTLMRRAGRAVLDNILEVWPAPGKLCIVCGTGNNGGDGFVIATQAIKQGLDVEIIQLGDAAKIKGDALQARKLAEQDGASFIGLADFSTTPDMLIVDALLGTGLSSEVKGDYATAIEMINHSGCPVVAVDVPSGLCSDTGRVMGDAVIADMTVSFIGLKQGLFTGLGPNYAGEVFYDDLAVPDEIVLQVNHDAQLLDLEPMDARMPCAHKGDFGHVMIVGGELGMAGAASLASMAATRAGAGLTSCATRPEHIAPIVARTPEVMAHGVISGQEVEPLLERPSVIVIGPGLGQGPWGEQLLQKVFKKDVPLVVDADALNIIAAGRVVKQPKRDNWILTPHPGEAARLLGCTNEEIQADRFAAVKALQEKFGGAVILKGAGSLVACNDDDVIGLCPYGNPGMGAGGMGDVLSGLLGALMAQGLTAGEAARLGVCLHGAAGDLASWGGERGTMASDLLPFIRTLLNDLELELEPSA